MNQRAARIVLVAVSIIAIAVLGACSSSGGSVGSKVTKTATNGAITVTAVDVGYDVGTIDATAGPLTVTFVNHGSQYHTFKVDGTSFELKANGGQTKTGTVRLAKGTYVFECTVPGHKGQGMQGKIVVT